MTSESLLVGKAGAFPFGNPIVREGHVTDTANGSERVKYLTGVRYVAV